MGSSVVQNCLHKKNTEIENKPKFLFNIDTRRKWNRMFNRIGTNLKVFYEGPQYFLQRLFLSTLSILYQAIVTHFYSVIQNKTVTVHGEYSWYIPAQKLSFSNQRI